MPQPARSRIGDRDTHTKLEAGLIGSFSGIRSRQRCTTSNRRSRTATAKRLRFGTKVMAVFR